MVREENGISLLDLLVVVARNLKLLILGPIIAGLLALGISYIVPQTYTSQALLDLGQANKATETMMRSPAVLDTVMARFPSRHGSTDAGREELSRTFRFTTAATTQTTLPATLLQVDADSPDRAQALANALIDAWLASTKPPPVAKQALERQLRVNREALDAILHLITRLSTESTKPVRPNEPFAVDVPVDKYIQIRDGYVEKIASIELQLRGNTRDSISSPPTLPTQPTAPKRGLIAILVTLGSGFALLLWVFMRQIWRNGAQDPLVAEKQAKLLAALEFRGRSN
jgi:capsular polysaccharide biosynthesis protein